MPFVEVFTPPGALTAEQREIIGQRLVAEVMRAEGAPDTAQARAISWLAWHDLQLWSVGGQPVAPDEAVRYVVRVAVPAASITDESRAEIIGRVTSVLAEADADPPRFFDTPCAYVLVDP